MPTKLTANEVLDAALDHTRQNATRLVICEGAPSNFTNANTLKGAGGNALVIHTIDNTNFGASADGDVSGRKMAFNQETGITITEAGTGDHIALIDTVNSVLLHVTPEDEERGNTAQAGAASTITLDTGASALDDHYNGMAIEILSGTGAGQIRYISDYVGATKVATVSSNWTTNPDATSVFTIYGKSLSASDDATVNAFDIEIEDPT